MYDAVADRQQLCAPVILMQPRANDSDGAAMMSDFIDVVLAISKRLSGGVLDGKPRLSPNAFHLSGGLGKRLIFLVPFEKSELEARRAGIGNKDERCHGDWSFSAQFPRGCAPND